MSSGDCLMFGGQAAAATRGWASFDSESRSDLTEPARDGSCDEATDNFRIISPKECRIPA